MKTHEQRQREKQEVTDCAAMLFITISAVIGGYNLIQAIAGAF